MNELTSVFVDSTIWANLLFNLAIGVTGIVAGVEMLHRGIRSAHWQRLLWQACTAATLVFVAGEFTGVGGALAGWARSATTARPMPGFDAGDGVVDAQAAQLVPALRHGSEPGTTAGDSARSLAMPAALKSGDDLNVHVAASTHDVRDARLVWCGTILWLAGCGGMFVRLIAAKCILLWFQHRACNVTDAAVLAQIRAAAGRLGCKRQIRVIASDVLRGPIAFGVLRPTIALPSAFTARFQPVEREAMLMHELAHLAGHDAGWQFFAELVTAMLWWHPLVWWSRHRLRNASESVADEASLLVEDGPRVLAACLVQLAESMTQPSMSAVVSIQGTGFRSVLGQRVERLMALTSSRRSRHGPYSRPFTRWTSCIVFASCALIATAWARTENEKNEFEKGETPMKALTTSWRRSLAGLAVISMLGSDQAAAQQAPGGVDDSSGTPAIVTDTEARIGATNQPTSKRSPRANYPRTDTGNDDNVYGSGAEEYSSGGDDAPGVVGQRSGRRRSPAQRGSPRGFPGKNTRRSISAGGGGMEDMGESSSPAPRIKVIRLKHRAPSEIRSLLQSLFSPGGNAFGQFGASMGMDTAAEGMTSNSARQPIRFTTHDPSHSLVVRGSADQIAMVEKVVTALDAPKDARSSSPISGNWHVFHARYIQARSLMSMLQELGFGTVALDAQTNSIIVAGSKAQLEEIGALIKALDVPGGTDMSMMGMPGMMSAEMGIGMQSRGGSRRLANAGGFAGMGSRKPAGTKKEILTIELSADQQANLFVNSSEINNEIVKTTGLADYLSNWEKRFKNPLSAVTVIVRAPASTRYDIMAWLTETLRKAGVKNMSFQTADGSKTLFQIKKNESDQRQQDIDETTPDLSGARG